MRKMVNTIKNIGVMACTGTMAIVGLAIGTVLFKPENITIINKNKNKES